MVSVASLTLRTVLVFLTGTTAVFAQPSDTSRDFQKCKIIEDDQARLDCFKHLLPGQSTRPAPSITDGAWPLIRTPKAGGGPDVVAIMRTADTTQSDPDLAGLMIRCTERPGLEVLLALVRPIAPRSKRDVVVIIGATETLLHAEASS